MPQVLFLVLVPGWKEADGPSARKRMMSPTSVKHIYSVGYFNSNQRALHVSYCTAGTYINFIAFLQHILWTL